MAACGSLRSLFDTQLPAPKKPMEASFTEIFGELHFQEKPESHGLDSLFGQRKSHHYRGDSKSSGGFSPKSSDSLQLCTEGLGSESSDDVDDLMSESDSDNWKNSIDHVKETKNDGNGCLSSYSDKRSRAGGRGFPPPISSIGRGGKPWVCFKSYREGGRFVLREIRIPTQEFLHASREDGRLKLHFVHPDSDIAEEDEEEDDDEEEQIKEARHEQEMGGEECIIDKREVCGG